MEFQKRLRELREELGLSHVRAIQTITPKGIVVNMDNEKSFEQNVQERERQEALAYARTRV